MSELPTFHEMTKSDDYANSDYLAGSSLVGASEMSLVRLENNVPGHYPDPPCAQFILTLITKGAGTAVVDVGPNQYNCRHRKGTLMLAPPAVSTDYIVDYTFDVSLLGLSNSVFQDAQEAFNLGNNSCLEQMYSDVFEDKFIEQLVHRIFAEAADENPNGALFVDQAASFLLTSLLNYAGRVKPNSVDSRALTPQQLELVTGVLEDRLQEKVNLDDLATLLGWNKFQFIRAFKAATGQAPYQFLLQRRVMRARDMLTTTTESLANIAFDCGFSSQSHLTSTFTKFMGVSPGAYRNEIRR